MIEFACAGQTTDRVRAALRNAPQWAKDRANRWAESRGEPALFPTNQAVSTVTRAKAKPAGAHRILVALAPGVGTVRGEPETITESAWAGVMAAAKSGKHFGVRIDGHSSPLVLSSRQTRMEIDPLVGFMIEFEDPMKGLISTGGPCSITFRKVRSERRSIPGIGMATAILELELLDVSLLAIGQRGAYPGAQFVRCRTENGRIRLQDAAGFRHSRRECVRRQLGLI